MAGGQSAARPCNCQLALRRSVRHRFDMTDSAKGHTPILAAGGVVVRGMTRPRIAVVRLRREKAWVLPKGKLLPREHPRDAAVREVAEETGYDVSVHEFLGSMSYVVEGRLKIVQFWLMRAAGRPVHALAGDVKDVKWLPLPQAIEALTRAHEKVFLTHVGQIALGAVKRSVRTKTKRAARPSRRSGDRLVAPVGHVIAIDFKKTRPNPVVKALGNWIGRANHALARRAG
jgi:8-oxo-dGTP pyrophosphatase MutT (NUDIX family)